MALPKDKAFERLIEARTAGRLAHAYLLAGPPGSGCEWLAGQLAATILGTKPEDLSSHPDFHQAAPESKSRRIVTEQIRELEQALHMKPLAGRNKVAVIHDADRLQPQAANAFLKTLEEPPPGSHIVLTTTLRDAVLTTILSRCITVPLQSPSGHMRDAHTTNVAEAFEKALLQIGGPDAGTALRFTRIFQAEMSEIREQATEGLESELKDQLKQYRDSIDKTWKDTRENQIKAQGESTVLRERERFLAALGTVLAAALRQKIRPSTDCPENIQKIAGANEAKTLLKRLDALERTRRLLSAGVQEALALESGFLQMIAHP
jgi:DNA polymerase-3 subunit delta'